MKHLDYEIRHYQPGLRSGVVQLLGELLGGDPSNHSGYFGWKYELNPHSENPLGIVALHEGRVVGFRGYGPARWQVGESGSAQVLVPGDTCVDINHRQKGLSVAMGRLAMTDYAATHQLFLNLSCTRNSLPGYLRLGFAPLADKVYLSRYGLPALVSYLLDSKKQLPLVAAGIQCGQFGDVVVSESPMPDEMASVIGRQDTGRKGFYLRQDQDFFRWRFSDPAGKFVFYYRTSGNDTMAYLVIAVTPSNRRGYVFDHADIDGESTERLLKFIIAQRDFSMLSVFDHSVKAPLQSKLRNLGFHAGGLMGALEKNVRGNMPLLVRPVRSEPIEGDWFVEGLDVRNPDNWYIKGVCSDSL